MFFANQSTCVTELTSFEVKVSEVLSASEMSFSLHTHTDFGDCVCFAVSVSEELPSFAFRIGDFSEYCCTAAGTFREYFFCTFSSGLAESFREFPPCFSFDSSLYRGCAAAAPSGRERNFTPSRTFTRQISFTASPRRVMRL